MTVSAVEAPLWRDRQFVLLACARIVSVLGNGFARVALAFAVLALPGASAGRLSLVVACQALPQLVLITPEREVPAHVADHYESRTIDELITSVLGHYDRLWPRIEELISTHAEECSGRKGLVLEGSALWPARVARLRIPRTAAVWLTTDDTLVRARVHTAGRYDAATDAEKRLMDKFLARTERYQTLMIEPSTGWAWIASTQVADFPPQNWLTQCSRKSTHKPQRAVICRSVTSCSSSRSVSITCRSMDLATN